MLTELKTVMQWYLDEPDEAWQFEELVFNDEIRDALADIGMNIVAHSSSARISTRDGHCYIPSQYLLYAIKLRPLATLIHRYMKIFADLSEESESLVKLKEHIYSKKTDNKTTDLLDRLSSDNFFRVFRDKEARLKAKDIFNGQDGKLSVRSTSEVFGSFILASLPVPNASSDILGKLVSQLTENSDAYDLLESKYSQRLPFAISAKTADELLFRLFFILTTKDWLKTLLDKATANDRTLSADGIENLFLFTNTPVAGNSSYFDRPLAYQSDISRYVHLKKGLLSTEKGLETVNEFLHAGKQLIEVRKHHSQYVICDRSVASGESRVTGGLNRIYYGAPGTGKSYLIDGMTSSSMRYVTVFHADTQYSDFVGSLKPVMRDVGGTRTVSYEFRPGKFTSALIDALNTPEKLVYLVIEEINRAPAASVFGEIFQLLDRQHCGKSRYSITLSDPDMEQFISRCSSTFDGTLWIPSNLSILATMNSSDQSVMPMDTAFKRRWLFEYLPIDYGKTAEGSFDVVFRNGDLWKVSWRSFSKVVNEVLSAVKVPEDRFLGHRFVSDDELSDSVVANETLISKVLVYLWDDVLRHGKRDRIFGSLSGVSSTGTFGQLSEAFRNGKAVFSEDFETRLSNEPDAYLDTPKEADSNES